MADTFTDAVESGAQGAPVFSQEGLDLVRTFEGFRPDAYYDLDNKKKLGKLTVGYGFTGNDIPGLKPGFKIDKAAAEKMLPDLINRKYAPAVLEKVKTPLNNQQFSALTSLVYNIGPTKFGSSTLLKKLNSGDYSGAAGEFKKWNKAGGKTLDGLVKRRRAEEALFNGETDTLGSILESQKFGVPEQGLGGKGSLSEAITPEPDLPSLPAESELTPEQKGAKVAEDIANDIGVAPEERGVEAAKRIAKSIEAGAETKSEVAVADEGVSKDFNFEEFSKGLAKTKKEQGEEDLGIPFAKAANFKTNLPSIASGLPSVSSSMPRVSSGLAANPGLGRKIVLGKNLSLPRS
jgi:lysozyme